MPKQKLSELFPLSFVVFVSSVPSRGAVLKLRHTILGKNLPPPPLSHFVTSI